MSIAKASSEAPRRAAGRPRDALVHAALLTATQDLLIEVGYDRLSIDAVAARAGTSKATVYRRWSGKVELVVAAVEELYQVPEVPDTGTLHEDLLACARAYVHENDRTQQVLAGLLTEMVRNESVRSAARAALGQPFAQLFDVVLQRAVERGLVDPHLDVTTVAALFPAMAFHRVAVEGRPVDEDLVRRVVDGCVMPVLSTTGPGDSGSPS